MVTAILTTNITYADYIVGNSIGNLYNIPVYSVPEDPKGINSTISTLIQNNVTNVIVLGGPAVISNLLLQDLNESNISYVWIWGTTRYETSAYAALYFWNSTNNAIIITRDLVNSNVEGRDLTLVTEAEQYAENYDAPIFIVPNGVLPSETIYALEKLNVSNVYIFTAEYGDLGNITNQLNSLNISYNIYNGNILSCPSYTYVNITSNTSWDDIREILIGKIGNSCIIPVINNNANITTEKEDIKDQIMKYYESERENNLNTTFVLYNHLDRLISEEQILLLKIGIICEQLNNSIPVCNFLPQLNSTIQQMQNSTGIQNYIIIQNSIQGQDWELEKQLGEGQFIKVDEELNLSTELEKLKKGEDINNNITVEQKDNETSDNMNTDNNSNYYYYP
ncbi:cell wall binding protein [Nanobdella aerobiophila]|uniref:Cell wall binding protein n=1 Tax=Nanobdella aerobiophila TaxID=2586965 RepID=A0A915WRB1_9ARCH|nr:hypothetical protein [Nanobdella aerobiophila]BBL45378.1 cell wall binding protein [Nanobdella aerobiophila]